MLSFLQESEEFYLTKSDSETASLAHNLGQLLQNNEESNQQLGLEIAMGGGIHPAFFYDLLLLYIWNKNHKIQELATQVLQKFLPIDVFQYLENTKTSYNYYASEKSIEGYLQKLTKIDLDAGILGWKFYQFTTKGKLFCLNQVFSFQKICEQQICHHTLSLANLKLTRLHPQIQNFPELKVLYLNENRLQTLPKTISKLKRLKILNLSNNKIKKISQTILQLSNLEILSFASNQLGYLPENMNDLPHLKYLNLSHNHLENLPDSMAQLSQLKVLDLRFNPLAKDKKLKNRLKLKSVLPQCQILY